MYHETMYILIDQLTKSCNFLNNFDGNEARRAKFDQFYFIGTTSNNFDIIKKDAILEKCIIIKNDNEEIFLTSLVDHQDN